MRPMPGDAIVVPEDLTRTTLTKDLKDWTQIFYQFGLGAAALKSSADPSMAEQPPEGAAESEQAQEEFSLLEFSFSSRSS